MIYFYKVIKGEIKMIYAYVRVSTKGQDTTRQFDIIREYANKNNLKISKTIPLIKSLSILDLFPVDKKG